MKINEVSNPKFIMLVGLPGSGKSTWISHFVSKSSEEWVVLSTDDIIDKMAQDANKTYSEIFKDVDFRAVQRQFDAKLRQAINNRANIIWDQTNTSSKARKKKLSSIPDYYETAAVVFEVPDDVLKQRLAKRSQETGKHIPDKVVSDMFANYEPPSKSEGFKTIHYIK
jgi:predicted kinase